MREISCDTVKNTVKDLFIKANHELPREACTLLHTSLEKESDPLARKILTRICENVNTAKEMDIPICQDTGMAVIFASIGREVHLDGSFEDAVNEGVALAYTTGGLRCSVVNDPLYDRKNTGNNTPAVIHTRITEGDKIELKVAPKGFGSENMSALKMFTPGAPESDIIAFVVETVRRADASPCPPIMIGVGIGGTFDLAPQLAKYALVRSVDERNSDPRYASLEKKMLDAVNTLGIGPQGFGGDTTALCVNIEKYPTHIAGLPVAVNINCHVMRHAEAII